MRFSGNVELSRGLAIREHQTKGRTWEEWMMGGERKRMDAAGFKTSFRKLEEDVPPAKVLPTPTVPSPPPAVPAPSPEIPMQAPTSEPVASSGTDPLDVWANLQIPVVTDFLAGVVRHTTGDEFLLTTSSEGLIVYTVGVSAITVGSLYIAPAYCASVPTYIVYGALASSIQYLAINALGNAINDAHSDSTIYGTAESAIFGGLLSMFGRLFRGGCFVADTPVTVSELPSLVELRNSYDSTRSWSGEFGRSGTLEQRKVPIESLSIGSRVPTKNPNRWEVAPQAEPDPATWAKLSITVQRSDGGVVDAELIRPRSWMEAYDLRAGRTIPLNLPELEVSGVATITAISACPPIATGEGSVITGRFMTRQVDEVTSVEILGVDGATETITGTSIHPVWSVDRQLWVPLGELVEGETLQGHDGLAVVLSVTLSRVAQTVYNIEVHGEHVYQVGELGVLVHNSCTNLNLNNAVGHFGLYEININGALYKFGKADLGRITQSSGLPTRLHQQVRNLEKIFGKGNVIGKVVEDLGIVTTETAKAAEHARILQNFKETGFLLIGNWKSFKL